MVMGYDRVWHMVKLEIFPDSDPLLRKNSKRVKHVDDDFRRLTSDMYEAMVAYGGLGLAAVQVGVLKRMFVYEIPRYRLKVAPETTCENETGDGEESVEIRKTSVEEGESEASGDTAEDKSCNEEYEAVYTGEYYTCINPKITEREGTRIDEEGCLSKIGWVADVERAYKITFEAFDINMNKFTRTVEGMEARCVQHEIDHLDGILFTDRAVEGSLRESMDDDEAEEEAGIASQNSGTKDE